jgi:hypothetical protein
MDIANTLFPLAVFWDTQIVRWVVWVGLVVLTIALLLLVRTRWGQSQPLGKCIVLSLVAHLLLGIYLTTVNIVTDTVGSPDGKGIQVAIIENMAAAESGGLEAWNGLPSAEGLGSGLEVDAPQPPPAVEVPKASEPERQMPAAVTPQLAPVKPPPLPVGEDPSPTPPSAAEAPTATTVVEPPPEKPTKETSSPTVESQPPPVPPPPRDPSELRPAESRIVVPHRASDSNSGPATSSGSGGDGQGKLEGSPVRIGPPKPLPDALRLRVGDHSEVAKGHGATQQSEAAVTAALKWLAANQSPGGRWDPRRLGAGGARAGDGQDRVGAGATADTGITGLALLAFLAAGDTHLRGPHQSTVRRGLEFLLSAQEADGNLGASVNMYEKMYCHAMATCALSEAYAMSNDERLANSVRRAIGFTIAAQDPNGGGWRYRPNDPGDTSQLGWQVMALKSAQLAGIQLQERTRTGVERFLRSVAGGRQRGLAYYQPIRPVPSRSMTAEALVCRKFLDIPDTPGALGEASEFVLQEPPGTSMTNYYYWYYGTLSMYQLQGEPWRRWNDALQRTLLATQRQDAALGGSWDPDPVWGGCGGRVYSTALATLCLEVYYRFLPLYVEAAGRERTTK